MLSAPNQESLVAAGGVRLRIRPAVRYSALAVEAGPAGEHAQRGRLLAQAIDGRADRAAKVHRHFEVGRDAVDRGAGQLGQQLVARAVQRQVPQQRPERMAQRGRRGHLGRLLARRMQQRALDLQQLDGVEQPFAREDGERQHVAVAVQVQRHVLRMPQAGGQHLQHFRAAGGVLEALQVGEQRGAQRIEARRLAVAPRLVHRAPEGAHAPQLGFAQGDGRFIHHGSHDCSEPSRSHTVW